MTTRKRPRMNITLDPGVKSDINETADELQVSTSRLIEQIIREFLEKNDEQPMVGNLMRKKIKDKQYETEAEPSEEEQQAREQIKQILDQFEDS